MAEPGYESIGLVGFSDKGDYLASKVYKAGDVVFSEGSSYLALKDNLQGVKPQNDGQNWRFMARGFGAELLSGVMALDQSGLLGNAGTSVNAQELMNVIADKVATKLLLKTDVVSQIVNDATKAASMAALYSVKQELDEVNSDMSKIFINRPLVIEKIGDNGSSISFFVKNGICYAYIDIKNDDLPSIPAYNSAKLVTIPNGYWPEDDIYVLPQSIDRKDAFSGCMYKISKSGEMRLDTRYSAISPTENSSRCYARTFYPVIL